MALLRRGSSRISEENFNCRLQREKAKTGAITASLAWNSPCDLDLHAAVYINSSGPPQEISYRNKRTAGGHLDVDMHARDSELVEEPVENIFWKKPPAGIYSITAKMFRKRGERPGNVPFRAILKREGEDDLSVEGAVGDQRGDSVECFRFTVDRDGEVTMGKVGTALPAGAAVGPMKRPARRAARAPAGAKAKGKAKAKAKAKAMKVMKKAMKKKAMKKKAMKASTVAKGKMAKVLVYKGAKVKTAGGLKKDDLVKSRSGKIVSKKASESHKGNKWCKAVSKARSEKGYSGFKLVKKGGSFYEKAKEIYSGL